MHNRVFPLDGEHETGATIHAQYPEPARLEAEELQQDKKQQDPGDSAREEAFEERRDNVTSVESFLIVTDEARHPSGAQQPADPTSASDGAVPPAARDIGDTTAGCTADSSRFDAAKRINSWCSTEGLSSNCGDDSIKGARLLIMGTAHA